jgi:hypothetical protein
LDLTDRDLDTGRDTQAGEYQLADETYAKLVNDVSIKSTTPVTAGLQKSILSFYSDHKGAPFTQRKKKDWQKLQDQLTKLKAMTPATAPIKNSQ